MLLVAAITMAGCGITPDTAPRDIEKVIASEGDGKGEAAIGTGQIFLVDADAGGVGAGLVSVKRDVDAAADLNPSAVLAVLFAGPNSLEQGNDITTALPVGMKLLRWSPRSGGVVAVDLTDGLRQLTGEQLILGLAQIVYTVAALEGLSGVRVTIEGVPTSWPDVNGRLQSDPLTVYDYPGLVGTSQPAFPAVPSD